MSEERKIEHERLEAVGAAILEHFDSRAGWSRHKYDDPDNYGHMVRLDGPQGMSLSIHGSGWAKRGRISIHGGYPQGDGWYPSRDIPRAQITVDAERAPADIAKDVGRRLMPRYMTSFEIAAKQLAEHNAFINAKASTLERFCAELGITPSKNGGFHFYGDEMYASGDTSDDQVHFQRMSVPIDVALMIASVLRGRKEALAQLGQLRGEEATP